jgi:16S rRNA (uracil1498-N3)-methyltransferase
VSTPRFFVDQPLQQAQDCELPASVAHHAVRVLRLRDGAPVVLFNGRGGEFDAVLRVQDRRVWARLAGFRTDEREAPVPVSLVQSWVASEKLDWIVEKAVELGAARIVLVPAERSVARVDGERRQRRLGHLRQLAIAACEQCGRNRVPAIDAADDLGRALDLAGAGRRFLLLPGAPQALVQLAFAVGPAAASQGLVLAIGPEGGFSDQEVARASALGCAPASLGPRVLRTETAGLAALAALQAVVGDIRASS